MTLVQKGYSLGKLASKNFIFLTASLTSELIRSLTEFGTENVKLVFVIHDSKIYILNTIAFTEFHIKYFPALPY